MASNSKNPRMGSSPMIVRSNSTAEGESTSAITRFCPATLHIPTILNPTCAALLSLISRSQTSLKLILVFNVPAHLQIEKHALPPIRVGPIFLYPARRKEIADAQSLPLL